MSLRCHDEHPTASNLKQPKSVDGRLPIAHTTRITMSRQQQSNQYVNTAITLALFLGPAFYLSRKQKRLAEERKKHREEREAERGTMPMHLLRLYLWGVWTADSNAYLRVHEYRECSLHDVSSFTSHLHFDSAKHSLPICPNSR